jgi:hypothetical protein
MAFIKGRGQPPDDGKLTYHGSAPRRVILKAGGQAARIAMALEQEGNGATRNHGRDTPGPGRQRQSR